MHCELQWLSCLHCRCGRRFGPECASKFLCRSCHTDLAAQAAKVPCCATLRPSDLHWDATKSWDLTGECRKFQPPSDGTKSLIGQVSVDDGLRSLFREHCRTPSLHCPGPIRATEKLKNRKKEGSCTKFFFISGRDGVCPSPSTRHRPTTRRRT